ncbi:MAG: LAGLIDADG endonuclease [Minisyncoccia bacterium]
MVKISKEQKAIIIGTLLGDGYIYKDKYGGCRLEIKHSDKQRDYVFWLYEKLSGICPGEPKQRKDNQQWKFNTESNDDIIRFRKLFYPNGKKIIPKNIKEILTDPLSLAVWYMDDGSLDFRPKSHCAFSLKTNSFTLNECEILSKMLKNNFGIVSSVQYPICRGKRYPQIYIGKQGQGRDQFTKLIRPFIIPCLQYKLPKLFSTPQRLDRKDQIVISQLL